MDTKDKLIEKLKEIFEYLNDRANTVTLNWSYYIDLRKEITALDKQVKEREVINKEDFFKWLKENGQLDKYEAALDISEDFTINQEIRIKACNDINLLLSEYNKLQIKPEKDFTLFIIKHIDICKEAFKVGNSHKDYKTFKGKMLIKLARKELNYKDTTYAGDIFVHLYKYYKINTEHFKIK